MFNTQKIDMIRFKKTVYPFCPMGNDNYKGEIVVCFVPESQLFDFCEVDRKIDNLGNKQLIIEDLVNAVFCILEKYNPKKLSVSVYGDSNRHFPVVVTKHT